MPQGHYFKYKDGKMELTRYWIPTFQAEEDKSLEYWVDEIEKTFDDSVEAHKISDVEVGSFLSSGVDSSYVACSAHVDKTFTVGFDNGTKYNEISYAQELSEQIPVKNISHIITPEEFWGNFGKIQYHMDEPLADPAAVALYFVCNLASQHLKVVLSGEGADEIFGGYNIYKEPLEMQWYDKIPFPLRKLIGKIAGALPAHRGLNFLVRRGKRLEERFIGNAYMFTEKERQALLKHPTGAPAPEALCKPYYDMVRDKDPVTKMQFVDLNMWMVGDILLKADKMSMANSLELRVPFLDKKIMALAGRIPLKYRVNEENTKYAMRKAALRRMPEKWAGKKKLGFPVPTRVWLKEDKYYNIVKEEFLGENAQKFFHTEKLVKLLDDHKNGKADNSRRVWTVYTFLIWYKQFFEASSPAEASVKFLMKLFSKSFDLALALSGRQPEKKLGKQRSVFPGRRRTEKVASRKLGCGPAPRTIPCPPPSLIPKGGTRLGRGDRKARCENLCRLWRHGGPPARVLHLKMSHRDIFSLSCACWRYKTVGRCPKHPASFLSRKLGKELYPPTARTCASGSHRRGVQPPSLGANCPARPRAATCLGCNPRELRAQALGQGRR